MANQEIDYIDAESFGGKPKDELTFKEIIMRHLIKLSGLASKEFCGGYWNEKTKIVDGVGVKDNYYVGDSREEYSNSIDFLHDMLHAYFDNEMLKASEENKQKLDESYTQCLNGDKLETQRYRDMKVELKRELLRSLSAFLKRAKYLTGKTFEESS